MFTFSKSAKCVNQTLLLISDFTEKYMVIMYSVFFLLQALISHEKREIEERSPCLHYKITAYVLVTVPHGVWSSQTSQLTDKGVVCYGTLHRH